MTLVANISIDGRPVLLSDLMLSRTDDGKEYKPFTTPLHLDPNPVVRSKVSRIVAGLSLKTALLSPRVAVAFAGSVSQAEFAIKILNDHLSAIKYDFESLLALLNERCRQCDNLYLTGLMILDKNEGGLPIARFSWPPDKGMQFSSQQFGDCYIGGSGSTDFANLLRAAEHLTITASRETNECENAVFRALSLAVHLSGEQTRLGTGLTSLYGCGFEIVTVVGSELVKFEDLAYHLLEVRIGNEGKVTLNLHSTLRYAYDKQLLLIRRLIPYMLPDTPLDDLFVACPVHHRPSDEEKAKFIAELQFPKYESRANVFYLHMPQAPLERRIAHLIHYQSSAGEPPIDYIEHDDGLHIELSADLLQRVANMVQRAVN